MDQQRIDMVMHVVHKTGVPFDEVNRVVDAQYRTVVEAMKNRKTMNVPHIGTFKYDPKKAERMTRMKKQKEEQIEREEE